MFKFRRVDKLVEAQLVEHEPKLVGWARFPFGHIEDLTYVNFCLSSLVLSVDM